MYGFVYNKGGLAARSDDADYHRRATRVTARPGVVINRGTAFEREDPDNSEGARKLIQQILEKIRDQAQGVMR